MTNIVRWFEDFPIRALDLLSKIEPIAMAHDSIGTLGLLVAPALITAPYERLQTYARRTNPQADYLHFPDQHREFNSVMLSPFRRAAFWNTQSQLNSREWRCSQVVANIESPPNWQDANGHRPSEDSFWSADVLDWPTRRVWKALRDSLAHWNVVTSDRNYHIFDESGVMEKLLFYHSDRDVGPWDVVTVSPDAFLRFLLNWAKFLGAGAGHEVLAATAAQ